MVQILPAVERLRKPTFSEKLGLNDIARNFGEGFSEGREKRIVENKIKQETELENQTIQRLIGKDISGIKDPRMREKYVEMALQQQNKLALQQNKQDFINSILRERNQENNEASQLMGNEPQENQGMGNTPTKQPQQQFNPLSISDEDIARLSAVDPSIGRELRAAKDNALKEKRHTEDINLRKFESERAYQTSLSKDLEKEADLIRNTIPKKELAMDFARSAIESGEVGRFSWANLGEKLGLKELQTAQGSKLSTSVKENLINNMGRVSSKAQNIWFEKRISSMLPEVGKSEEANLTAQEALEAELAMDKAYINEFDRLADEDEKNFGYTRKDIAKRSRQAVKPMEDHIFKRATYRMKEIEEQEKGLDSLKAKVGKNVDKGTPLTLAMAKLYKDKYKENALKVAEKNGYYIPTIEDFQSFRSNPREYREGLNE